MEKTCLNCGNRMNDCVRFKSGTGAIYVRECGHHEWDTLEQRYAQLEQVAKSMYKAIAPMHENCCDDTCVNLGEMGWDADYCLNTFRHQLEALGVSLDD